MKHGIAMLAVALGMLVPGFAAAQDAPAPGWKVDRMDARRNRKMDKLNRKMARKQRRRDAKMDRMSAKMDRKMAKEDRKMERMAERMERR
jgi:hypothetical protein